MTSSAPMDQFQAADALLKYVYSGVIGVTKGLAVDYALMRTTDSTFTFSAALEPLDHLPEFIDRYQIEIDRQSGQPSTPRKIEIADEELKKAVLAATGEEVASSRRFTDGGFSTSYKVTAMHNPDFVCVVQQRFHGNVASMDAFMKFVRANSAPGAIPMAAVYSIPGEADHQQSTGFGRQITQFVPGVLAERVYSDMPHTDRLELVRKMALAWQACWDLPLPSPRQIGELIATDNNGSISLTVGPDRHFSMGGPFTSVREWLKGRLRHAVSSLARTSGIDEYKDEYMAAIQAFVDDRLDRIPYTVEECPIAALHIDMGLHNVLVAEDNHTELKAIIDWELCASAPFMAAYPCLEMLFRMGAPNGFGAEYPHADALRSAFWDAIPTWKARWESQGARDFMGWFRFALFLRPEYCSKEKTKAEKWEFWAENIRVVEDMLKKYNVES
ncbi:hypothetical protein LLEC1_06975 [Akanthomyces lecanii]|uniref:Aminoglycoside phosphotransferase domain-containing protein n=1 Tax=Cordyceps confragosa TaxID=2714763 RepID=A0A179IGX5_CORDF|nr:hypothetical protein LLEC1_06975 [Akanthomyces lecanii]